MARSNPQVIKKIQNIILHPEMVPVALLQSALGFQNNNGGADGTFHRDLISHGKWHGFIYVDMDDKGNGTLERKPKKSYYWMKDVIASNGEKLWAE